MLKFAFVLALISVMTLQGINCDIKDFEWSMVKSALSKKDSCAIISPYSIRGFVTFMAETMNSTKSPSLLAKQFFGFSEKSETLADILVNSITNETDYFSFLAIHVQNGYRIYNESINFYDYAESVWVFGHNNLSDYRRTAEIIDLIYNEDKTDILINIKEEDIKVDKVLILNVNTFELNWEIPFAPALPNSNETNGTEYMMATGNFSYYDSDAMNATIVELPYKGNFVMYKLAPKYDNESLAEFITRIDFGMFQSLLKLMQKVPRTVYLPKFIIDMKSDMREIMLNAKYDELFYKDYVNFDKLGKQFKLPTIVQKVHIAIHESATDVNDVTFNSNHTTINNPSINMGMMAKERPFVFLIMNVVTGTIHFAGKVMSN